MNTARRRTRELVVKGRTDLPAYEIKLLDDALAAFTRTTGFPATIVRHAPEHRTGRRPDAAIKIEANGRVFHFFVEIKAIDRGVALAAAKHQLEPYGKQGMLVTPYLTPELANHCRQQLDLNFIDAAGNAYVRGPGLFVFVRGERIAAHRATAIGGRGGGTATALRVVFALLCKPELVNAPYRDIVAAADVALGAVGWVFFDLQQRGYIAGGLQMRNRRLLERTRVLDEWVTNFPIKLRPKLHTRRFHAPDPGWWQHVRLEPGARWGGEVAAARLTDYLKPAAYTIYLNPQQGGETLAALVKRHRLRADANGNVEVLDAFWNFDAPGTPLDLVPPLLVYADLMATLDPRNLEVAKRIRTEHLEDAVGRA
jgi:hypothetical protein